MTLIFSLEALSIAGSIFFLFLLWTILGFFCSRAGFFSLFLLRGKNHYWQGNSNVGREMAGSISLQFYAHTPNHAETKKYIYIDISIYVCIFMFMYVYIYMYI